MFDFFRKYQRYFFLLTTIVIVISFSFFGTFGALSDGSFREQIAFTNVNGTDVTRHELDEMVQFISTDATDKQILGGVWGPNFLNDGVIRKSFLETGLASMLLNAYQTDIQQDLVNRHDKERRHTLYVHPEARFIGTESAWNYFLPGMSDQYKSLRSVQDPISKEGIQARINLYLMERQLPPSLLRQVLRYQEKQYTWLRADQNLDRMDLSLFGYHTTEDWFGPRFIRLVAEFVMNAAVIAENRGYYVSKAEAAADLMRNSEQSFQQTAANSARGVTNSSEYFNEQLRRLGMDRNMAIKVWQQVLLFRRLFQDEGSSVFVDTHTFKDYDAYAAASVDGQLYQLPKELRLASFRGMQKLETYLDAVSNRTDNDKLKLIPTTTFLAVGEIAKKTPSLVQKRYLLDIAQTDKKSLESNISVKDTWSWETDDAGWTAITKQFPDLALKTAANRDSRYQVLDQLDDKTRARVDAYARSQIIDSHPEWIDKALGDATLNRQTVGLRDGEVITPFVGLVNGKTLMQLLDTATIHVVPEGTGSAAAKEANLKLQHFTADNLNYYRITIIDRANEPEIFTFAEADRQGILDKLLDKNLEAYYIKIRESDPKDFQREDKSWKSFDEVKNIVADRYFEKTLKAIRSAYIASIAPQEAPQEMINEYTATLRFLPYVSLVKEKLEKSPTEAAAWIKPTSEVEKVENTLAAPVKLTDQWRLESIAYKTSRGSSDNLFDKSTLFALKEGSWTKVNSPADGNINFFYVKQREVNATEDKVLNTVGQTRFLLSNSAQQSLMDHLLKLMNDKKAISLAYLNQSSE